MGISRAQYIQGDNSFSPVLAGQVQGVKAGFGVSIALDGTLSVLSSALPKSRIINLGVLETIDGLQTSFTLVEYGTTIPYTLAVQSNLAVFLGGVPQLPSDSYTVAASQVTFVTPPPADTVFLAITVANV
jgi:hypothetical protein